MIDKPFLGRLYMAEWNIFKKLKSTQKKPKEVKTESSGKPTIRNLAEYHETLYSDENIKSNIQEPHKKIGAYSGQRICRDVDSIGEKIDHLSPGHDLLTSYKNSTLERRIDKIVKSKRAKKTRKPSNVIYVVSKPQPGQVRGDWAVRSHGKIYSYHRKKDRAIEEARKIARDRDATVMIQNTDGTFSDGFKPRPKK